MPMTCGMLTKMMLQIATPRSASSVSMRRCGTVSVMFMP